MLAAREALTLRGLVNGTGVSTMAVYTYFDGMRGLLGAVRQEGFTRLARRLAQLDPTEDAVCDMAAAGAAYAASARDAPDLYRVMFDGNLPLPDRDAADDTLGHLVAAVARASDEGRFSPDLDPSAFAHELWMLGHGACSLVATKVLAFSDVEPLVTSGLVRLYISAGDDPTLARASLDAGWQRGLRPPH